ncbi:IclR family transcriptional regulator domain-containing protein [Streptomyces longwoodensis]|uniref:IclR family transcriptional regulator domain-containing protein n=1 Tax=Streptomyces longwoodensis TaxID=68231 RepID=UPI003AF248A1
MGLRLWETAVLAPRASTLAETAQPHFIGPQRQTGGVATVAVRDGREAVCLTFVSSDPDPGPYDAPGRRVPLHATALGPTLLAHAGSLAQQTKWARCGPTPRRRSPTARRTRCLAKVRRRQRAGARRVCPGPRRPSRCGTLRGAVVVAVGVIGPVPSSSRPRSPDPSTRRPR